MSELFNILDNICFSKKKTSLTTYDEIKEFSPYMINRWITMIDPNYAPFVNKAQKLIGTLTPQQYYEYLILVIPKIPRKRYSYIKGEKITKDKFEDVKEKICEIQQISRKELDSMKLDDILLKQIQKSLETL